MAAGLQCWDASGTLVFDSETHTLRFDFEDTQSLTFGGYENTVAFLSNATFDPAHTLVVAAYFYSGRWWELQTSIAAGGVYLVRRPRPSGAYNVHYRVFRF